MLSRRRFHVHVVLVAAGAILIWLTTHHPPAHSKLRSNRYRWAFPMGAMYAQGSDIVVEGVGDIALPSSDPVLQPILASPDSTDDLVSIPNPYAIDDFDELAILSHAEPPSNSPAELYPESTPLIQLIMVWNDHGDNVHPQYLPNFLASIAANPIVDLLMIRYDRYRLGHGCADLIASHIPNIRELCYGLDDFWNEHADFLCHKWGCSVEERIEIFNILMKRRDSDPTSSAFKPLRYAIWNKHVNPQTKTWGYCDVDAIFGNIQRTFPWDLVGQFDIFVAAAADDAPDSLVFLRGHGVYFSTSTHTINQAMMYPSLVDFQRFRNERWFGAMADEAEWSFYLLTNDELTFTTFPAMADSRFHLSRAPPNTAVYELREHWAFKQDAPNGLIPLPEDERGAIIDTISQYEQNITDLHYDRGRPTFTNQGSEYETELRVGEYDGLLWFDQQFAIHVTRDEEQYSSALGQGNRYILRRDRGGPVYDRQEPHKQIPLIAPHSKEKRVKPYLQEFMYNHLRGEQYKDWWEMPEKGYQYGQTLYVDRERGAEMWNERGEVVWRSAILPPKEIHSS